MIDSSPPALHLMYDYVSGSTATSLNTAHIEPPRQCQDNAKTMPNIPQSHWQQTCNLAYPKASSTQEWLRSFWQGKPVMYSRGALYVLGGAYNAYIFAREHLYSADLLLFPKSNMTSKRSTGHTIFEILTAWTVPPSLHDAGFVWVSERWNHSSHHIGRAAEPSPHPTL